MAVREDCRHYQRRSTPTGEAVERCRIDANTEHPFACPDGCLFFEERQLSSAGWTQDVGEPMTNTELGLLNIPEPPKGKRGRRKRR
jgi:hypothetical protein